MDTEGKTMSASRHQARPGLVAWSFAAIVAPLVIAGACLAVGVPSGTGRVAIFAAGLVSSVATAAWFMTRALPEWRTLGDVLSALREGDYGIRGRLPPETHPLRGMIDDINHLSDTLREGRRKRTESLRFLGKTLTALQDPIFVVDGEQHLVMINPSARALIGAANESIVGRDVQAMGLGPVIAAPNDAILSWDFAARSGRWIVRRALWYSEGRENTMVMLHDVSAALGDEERSAWQRLIRVLSHELNNSLAPIGSLADSLSVLLNDPGGRPTDAELREGLDVIGRRASSLTRFLSGYGRLARLPPLRAREFRLDLALRRLARLEHRVEVVIDGTADIVVVGDEDQLDQAFINLLRNAAESAQPVDGGVRVDWVVVGPQVRVTIEDEGGGLPERSSLFVPFFTTKPAGSGIGLSLTRLIVEAHAGSVDLRARPAGRGALAIVMLPLGSAGSHRPEADDVSESGQGE